MFEQAELGDIILCMSKRKGGSLTGSSQAVIDNICLIVRLTDEDSIIKQSDLYVMRVGDGAH